MRHFTLLLTLLGLVLFIAPAGAQPPQGSTTITFNGFCDGATIVLSGDFIRGSHNNYDCAGSNTFLAGVVSTVSRVKPAGFKGGSDAVLMDNVLVMLGSGCPLVMYLDFQNSGWAFYTSCDGVTPETLLNRGTFTVTPNSQPKAHFGGVAAWQGAGVPDDSDFTTASSYPKGPYSVSFDGYCDFLAVNTKGNTLGGTHDLATNCDASNVPAAGNNANQPGDLTGTSGPGAFLTDNEALQFGSDCMVNFILTWSNSTWAAYESCNDIGNLLINSGTFKFTAGTPVPSKTKGLPMTAGRAFGR